MKVRSIPFGYVIIYDKYEKTLVFSTYYVIGGWSVVKTHWRFNSMNAGIQYKWAVPYNQRSSSRLIPRIVMDILEFGCPVDVLISMLLESNMISLIKFTDI